MHIHALVPGTLFYNFRNFNAALTSMIFQLGRGSVQKAQ